MIDMKQEVVIELVLIWQGLLGFKDWEVNVTFGLKDGYAESVIDCAFEKVDMQFNMDKIKSKKDLTHTIIHEFVHAQLYPFTQAANVFAGKYDKVLEQLEEKVVLDIEDWPVWSELE